MMAYKVKFGTILGLNFQMRKFLDFEKDQSN